MYADFRNEVLGGESAKPEFHGLTWFTMLLAAGMGMGLVFFGVAEPIGADTVSTGQLTPEKRTVAKRPRRADLRVV